VKYTNSGNRIQQPNREDHIYSTITSDCAGADAEGSILVKIRSEQGNTWTSPCDTVIEEPACCPTAGLGRWNKPTIKFFRPPKPLLPTFIISRLLLSLAHQPSFFSIFRHHPSRPILLHQRLRATTTLLNPLPSSSIRVTPVCASSNSLCPRTLLQSRKRFAP